jgi:hypothetical protein
MTTTTKKAFAYVPVAFFWALDWWAFTTGSYASEKDKVLPFLFAVLVFLYMMPAINAADRDHSQFLSVWLVDLLGTPLFLFGWLIDLMWAFIDSKR